MQDKMMTEHVVIHGAWPDPDVLDRVLFEYEPHIAFMDPPDNIGLKYKESQDQRPADWYASALSDWMYEAYALIARDLWVSFNSRHTRLVSKIADRMEATWNIQVRPMVQIFTFGQHNQYDFGNNHRPIWRFRPLATKTNTDQIRVPSQRQLSGDKRADARGRVPGDVFDFPRVVGNSGQRRKWHPTQLNEGLVERCLLASAKPGETVLDLFSGTGTVIRVAKRLGMDTVSVESSKYYCEMIAREHPDVEVIC